MTFETRRLIIRPWTEADAPILYTYASEPILGLSAGWAPHTSEHESLRVIQGPLGKDEVYAIVLRETGEPIGSVGFLDNEDSDLELKDDEAEVGYWIGYPHWGNGYALEAVRRLLKHAFDDLNMESVWGSYFDENVRSGKVLSRAGFVYHHTEARKIDALGDERIVHYAYISELPPAEDDGEE